MTTPISSPPQDEFLAIARQLGFLDDETCTRLVAETQAQNVRASHLALVQGLLDAAQVEIVETLRRPGEIVPGLEILKWVGRGGMGVVYRARQKSLDRIVAIKTIPAGQMHDATAIARFQQEALAVAKLRHPNIVAAYDFGRHAGRLYFVMEWIDGLDVQRQVEIRGPLPEVHAWRLLRQAALGLSHAASAGIIHRDIKPANLLVVSPPAGFEIPGGGQMVKIADFGLAFLTGDLDPQARLTATNTTIGSPHYLAPEQLEGRHFDQRVDIYALGATAYHLVTGEAPFLSETLAQIVSRKLTTDCIDSRNRFPQLSSDTSELIRDMTRRDVAARISSYPELLQRIDALIARNPQPTAAPRPASPDGPTQIVSADPTPAAFATRTAPNSASAPTPRSRRKFLGIIAAGVGVAIIIAIIASTAAWSHWPIRSRQEAAVLVPMGLRMPLFDGMSLNAWHNRGGSWSVRRKDNIRILAGTSGAASHVLADEIDKQKIPLTYYRVSATMRFRDAQAAGIEFGRDISLGEDSERYVARLTKESVTVGTRADSVSPFRPDPAIPPVPIEPRETHLLAFERQPDSWRVLVDDRLVGRLPVRPQPTAADFALRAEDKEVWFSDINVQALGARQPGDSP